MKKIVLVIIFLIPQYCWSQSNNEIDKVVEDFRLGIIALDNQSDWSKLFLHDSITWAMVRDGDTELFFNNKSPDFRFYTSTPIEFYEYLKSQGNSFEEKFYNVNTTYDENFATVDFLYSFHKEGEIVNWGKEYWSLIKVKNEWKISGVMWTENLQHIEPCPFINLKSFALSTYVCPPCPFGCDKNKYAKPGTCSTCSMTLIPEKNVEFDGYLKSKFFIQSNDVKIFAAYYLPENIENLKGGVVIAHGSAPSTHNDVGYYSKLATQLNMAVLTYDKRGVGLSEGKYEPFTVERSNEWFQLLAQDLLSCYDWIRKRPELKGKKIGFFGGSQAGWIMPLAASKANDVDFIIIGEGVSVSAGEEQYFSSLTGDGGSNKYSITKADDALKKWTGSKGYDPRKILKELEVSTLWIFGTDDPVIPVDASIRELNKIANPNFSIEVLENGNHDFVNTQTSIKYDLSQIIGPWLIKNGITNGNEDFKLR